AALLGPDVDDSAEAYGLFVADVVRDMTQKTGQKCTAIRRVYVPREKVEAVVGAIGERLGAVKVGDPAREDTTMGPLATRQQLLDVRAGAKALEGCAKVAIGSLSPHADKGFFFPPVLLRADAPAPTDRAHTHEVFGPVATVMPYDGTA